MSAQMQQHTAQVRKTMRQASSENTFALEELSDELKDAKHCLTRAKRPHIKALLAAQLRYAAAEELRLLSGADAPASVAAYLRPEGAKPSGAGATRPAYSTTSAPVAMGSTAKTP